MDTTTKVQLVLVLLAMVCLPEAIIAARQNPSLRQAKSVQDKNQQLSEGVSEKPLLSEGDNYTAFDAKYNHDAAWKHSEHAAFSLFQAWMAKYQKAWESSNHMEQRFRIFVDNLHYIETRNRQVHGYRLGPNRFADLTHDEFKRAYLHNEGSYAAGDHHAVNRTAAASSTFIASRRRRSTPADRSFLYGDASDIPRSIDWSEKGALVGIKDQGRYCGSDWAFSSVAAVEAANQIATGKLIPLSEQELVECDILNQGCHGGSTDYAFEFIIQNGGLDSERDYPYTGRDGLCDIKKRNSRVVSIDGYEAVPGSNESALLQAVAHQPVSVMIDADGRDLQLYSEGVFSGRCGKELNHAVLVVGYGSEADSTDYWILRNSWGKGWGEQGYSKMLRVGLADRDGLCGINLLPSYPIKKERPGPTPPTPDLEVVCDEQSSCPPGTTCCCEEDYFKGACLQWGCCPEASATCCGYADLCCPHGHPICDLYSGTCFSDITATKIDGLKRMTPFRRVSSSLTRNASLHVLASSQKPII